MDLFRKYLSPQVLSRLRGLSLHARQVVEGRVSGAHRSPFHGFSAEFAQHREYTPGDDLRYVDWKTYGRTDRYFVKQFQEETNLPCYLCVDVSRSMAYRSTEAPWTKLEYAERVAAALAYLVLRQHDSVGLMTYAASAETVLRPSSSAAHLQQILQVFESVEPAGVTNMLRVLDQLAERLQRRSVIVLCSDCFAEPEDLIRGLKHLRHRRHDVSVLQVIDPAEAEFPFEDPTEFRDLESPAKQTVDAKRLRAAYREVFEHQTAALARQLRNLAVDYHLLNTSVPPESAVVNFLQSRGR